MDGWLDEPVEDGDQNERHHVEEADPGDGDDGTPDPS
jgi:hypothetical protein